MVQQKKSLVNQRNKDKNSEFQEKNNAIKKFYYIYYLLDYVCLTYSYE